MEKIEIYVLSDKHYSVFINGHNIKFSDEDTKEKAISILAKAIIHIGKQLQDETSRTEC